MGLTSSEPPKSALLSQYLFVKTLSSHDSCEAKIYKHQIQSSQLSLTSHCFPTHHEQQQFVEKLILMKNSKNYGNLEILDFVQYESGGFCRKRFLVDLY